MDRWPKGNAKSIATNRILKPSESNARELAEAGAGAGAGEREKVDPLRDN